MALCVLLIDLLQDSAGHIRHYSGFLWTHQEDGIHEIHNDVGVHIRDNILTFRWLSLSSVYTVHACMMYMQALITDHMRKIPIECRVHAPPPSCGEKKPLPAFVSQPSSAFVRPLGYLKVGSNHNSQFKNWQVCHESWRGIPDVTDDWHSSCRSEMPQSNLECGM